jgi:peptide/nickel transport system permease protein
MLRLILRRLLVVLPTLVGVTLVSFALLVLAPPPRDGLESEASRALFLDLPLFVSGDPRDLEHDVADALAAAAAGRTPRELAPRGAVLVPMLVPRLGSLPDGAQRWALEQLAPLAGSLAGPEELADAHDDLTFWADVYEARKLDFRPSNVRRLVRRLRAGTSRHASVQLRSIGTFALPELVTALDEDASPDERQRVVAMLTDILPDVPPARLRGVDPRAPEAWREWWFVHRPDYVVFDRFDRAVGVLTETRYGKWIARLVTLRLGTSAVDGEAVAGKILSRGAVTILLATLAALVALLLAVPLGTLTAVRRGGLADRVVAMLGFVLYSLPVVWVGTLVLGAVCGAPGLAIFPAGGLFDPRLSGAPLVPRLLDLAWHLAMPVLCLAYPSLIVLSRHQRSAVLNVIRTDYVRTARAKGVPEHLVIRRHVLRNALLPVVTLAGLEVPLLVGTSVLVEELFAIPGLGRETVAAVAARDVSWLVAVTAAAAIVSVIGLLVGDLFVALVDPRTRRSAGGGGVIR